MLKTLFLASLLGFGFLLIGKPALAAEQTKLISLASLEPNQTSASSSSDLPDGQIFTVKSEEISLDPQTQTDKTAEQNNQPSFSQNSQLELSLSPSLINLGEVLPGEPILRILKIKAGAGDTSAQLFVFEDQALRDSLDSQNQIPDTACDNGTCNKDLADTWDNPLAYGFGYRCDNSSETNISQTAGCTQDFLNKTAYKSFADQSQNQAASQLLKLTPFLNFTGNITYKINVSPSQKSVGYQNETTFILLPNL